jgi:D-alanyl-lipoteichoic acid acyltransferase DltB (MBOAT superfamily)
MAIGTLFANVISGPIARPRELLTQIRSREQVPFPSRAALLIAAGMFKRHIGETLAINVPELYRADMPLSARAIALLCEVGEFYADLSGYTDVARGMAMLFGLNLPENFDLPYLAKNMADFWRRWHMSLSFWFRDYVYYPLQFWLQRKLPAHSGPGVRKMAALAAVLIAFILIGLWHRIDSLYLYWGIGNGLMVFIAENYSLRFPTVLTRVLGKIWLWIGIAAGEAIIMSEVVYKNYTYGVSRPYLPQLALDNGLWLVLGVLGLVIPHALDILLRQKMFDRVGWQYLLVFAAAAFGAMSLGPVWGVSIYGTF